MFRECLLLPLRPQLSGRTIPALGFALTYFQTGNADLGLAGSTDKDILHVPVDRFFEFCSHTFTLLLIT